MSGGPVPTRLIFLSDLVRLKAGEKVRFVGCVQAYDPSAGALTLTHNYPASVPPVIAYVNVDHVLETLKSMDLAVGAWVNIIGYVVAGSFQREGKLDNEGRSVHAQALVLWAAEGLDLKEYERGVKEWKAATRSKG